MKGLNGALTTGKEAGTENILMVGSTSRCALTVQNAAYGLCSQGVNGVNSDVIMILHADPAHHRLALLSIPRDLFIPNARSTGANKVDAGLFQGLTQLVAAIEEDFGIPIQHAVSLNFDQFANVVDALGGINMSFPMSVFDAESGLNVQAATCVHLNGTQALEVVRARHLQYDSGTTTSPYAEDWPQENLSDLARIRRDHEFLRVLGAAVAKQGLGNPITDLNLINSVKSDLTFDQSWSVSDMANLVLDFHSVNINSVPQLTLPVAGGDRSGRGRWRPHLPGRQLRGRRVPVPVPGPERHRPGARHRAEHRLDDRQPAAGPVVGDRVGGQRHRRLQPGHRHRRPRSPPSGSTRWAWATPPRSGDVAETVVYYGSRSAAVEAAAQAVARSMTGSVIMAYDPSQVTDGAEVTVVTGTQFAVNAPAAPTTPTTAAAGAAGASATTTAPPPPTTTPTTSPDAAAIAAPSPTTSSLEPWDPRACPPGATPTAPVANPT